MRYHKHSSGRLQRRASGGRFAKNPTLEDLGFNTADGPRVCNDCDYGLTKWWHPLLVTGKCPNCGSQESSPLEYPMTKKLHDLQTELKGLTNTPHINPRCLSEISRLEREIYWELADIRKEYWNQFKNDEDQ